MQTFDRGSGVPLVLVPGIQGRWEYLRPTLDALATSFRVIAFPLGGKRAGARPFDATVELDALADQLAAVLDERRLERSVICGISFGGLVTLRFAARHPDRTSALVLASTPGPDFRLSSRHETYIRAPWIFGPLFLAETPRRLHQELVAAIPEFRERRRFAWRQAKTVVTAPLSPSTMARRARIIGSADPGRDCARISAPTLVITGEPGLDRVVRVESTLEYVRRIPGARWFQLHRTGHVGYLTRPQPFVAAIREFLSTVDTASHNAA
jgi:pimeloyl-ACP methyl ester carboxylesterase